MSLSMRTLRRRHRRPARAPALVERIWERWRHRIAANWQVLSAFRIDRNVWERVRTTRPSHLIRTSLLAALALLLVWLVISSYEAYQASVARETALDLDAVALAVAARDAAAQSNASPGNTGDTADSPRGAPTDLRDRVRAEAAAALLHDPLNARALSVLGQLAEASGDHANAAGLMEAAAHRSLRESVAVFWLMLNSYKQENYATAAYYADALLRTRPQFVAKVAPFLARMAENKAATDDLNKLLASNPPWRSQFLAALPGNVTDARTPLQLLLNLRGTATPPTTGDLRNYLNFLINHKFYDVAYYLWLQFLPPEELSKVGFLFNGDFENAPSGLPFDWVITQGSGVTVDITARPDEPQQRALFVEFGYGRVEFRGVSQLTMLAPGTYQFSGRYKGELLGRRGLTWRATCAGGSSIGQSAMITGTAPTWKDLDFVFTVPRRDCGAQYVQLFLDARSASEQFVSGSMWFDDLNVSRVEPSSANLSQQDPAQGSDLPPGR